MFGFIHEPFCFDGDGGGGSSLLDISCGLQQLQTKLLAKCCSHFAAGIYMYLLLSRAGCINYLFNSLYNIFG